MIILQGTLRQRSEVNMKAGPAGKLWIEHSIPRDNGGAADLKIEEIFLPVDELKSLPGDGEQVSVNVRPYPRGKGIGFAGISVTPSLS